MQPYRQQSLRLIYMKEINTRTILSKAGKVAYELQLPALSKVHPNCHVSFYHGKMCIYISAGQMIDNRISN
ncbi:hypothetical protein Hanom_Chr15g01363011 [Helianthus anomalus]